MAVAIELTVDQLKKINDNGFCYIEVSPFNFVRFTMKDLRIKKEDLERIKRGELTCDQD